MTAADISARRLIYKGLLEFEQHKTRLDDLFGSIFSEYNPDNNAKRHIHNVISGTVRHLLYIDWIISGLYHGNYKKLLNKLKSLLRPAVYEIIFLSHIPPHATVNEYVEVAKKTSGISQSKTINGILRTLLRTEPLPSPKEKITDPVTQISIQYSFPLWLVKRWAGFFGLQETEKLCAYLNTFPDFDIRINEQMISRENFLTKLQKAGIDARPSVKFSNFIKVNEMQSFIQGGWIADGLCYVQDESASIPVRLLNPAENDWILDVCAAPGGKYTQILESNAKNISAVAVDSDHKRLKKVKENASGYPGRKCFYVAADGRKLPFKIKFDKILVDAPCSGLGVIRKRPDIKWRREMKDIVEFSGIQYDLLKEAAAFLKSKGKLVYSTCTIDELENTEVIKRFLEKQIQFKLEKIPESLADYSASGFINTIPHRHHMDGSFAAILTRKDKIN